MMESIVFKVEDPFDELVEYARHERKTGKSLELREFAKKHKIPVKKPVKKVSAKRGKKA